MQYKLLNGVLQWCIFILEHYMELHMALENNQNQIIQKISNNMDVALDMVPVDMSN